MSTGDRYAVNPLDDTAAFAEWRRSIERQIGALQGAPLDRVTIRATDPLGRELVTAGKLADGNYGFEVRSETNGWDLVRMTDDGWIKPHLQGAPYDTAAVKSVTSGTFADQWGVLFGDALGPGIEIMVPWQTASGTTGELKVVTNVGGATLDAGAPRREQRHQVRALATRRDGRYRPARHPRASPPCNRCEHGQHLPVPRVDSRPGRVYERRHVALTPCPGRHVAHAVHNYRPTGNDDDAPSSNETDTDAPGSKTDTAAPTARPTATTSSAQPTAAPTTNGTSVPSAHGITTTRPDGTRRRTASRDRQPRRTPEPHPGLRDV